MYHDKFPRKQVTGYDVQKTKWTMNDWSDWLESVHLTAVWITVTGKHCVLWRLLVRWWGDVNTDNPAEFVRSEAQSVKAFVMDLSLW